MNDAAHALLDPAQPLRSFREGDLVAVKIGTDYRSTDRLARVVFADRHSDALALEGVDGRPVEGNVVSIRLMSELELADWENYGRPLCAGCGVSHDVVVGVQADEEYCAACALALVLLVGRAA